MSDSGNNIPFTEVKELGEFGLIKKLQEKIPIHNASTIKAGGDDAAVLDYAGFHTVISTDMFVEGVHFDITYSPLQHLGYKLIAATISDIYAMNAHPEQIFVSIALPNRISIEMIDAIYDGMLSACETYGVDLAGGDTTASGHGMIISLTATGKAKAEDICYRDGAKEHDLICVSGDLGGAYLGLQLLEREKRIFMENPDIQPDLTGNDYILKRHLKPEPRKDIIEVLADLEVKPTSMIDISDGLSSELLHICHSSKTGCAIYEEKIPIDPKVYDTARYFSMDPTLCALSGGEDYELLFTIKQADFNKIEYNPDITVIGHITAENEGRVLVTRSGNRHELKAQGWNAFK